MNISYPYEKLIQDIYKDKNILVESESFDLLEENINLAIYECLNENEINLVNKLYFSESCSDDLSEYKFLNKLRSETALGIIKYGKYYREKLDKNAIFLNAIKDRDNAIESIKHTIETSERLKNDAELLFCLSKILESEDEELLQKLKGICK